jgi:hypothetical protein
LPAIFLQEGFVLVGPMAAHLLTGGHGFTFSEEYGSYVPTAVDMVEKLYSCMWDYTKKIHQDMVRLEIWDRMQCSLRSFAV